MATKKAPAKKTAAKKPTHAGTELEKKAKRQQVKHGVKVAKKLLAAGKLPEGHIRRLGVKRQTLPRAKSREDDLARNAMLAGYRVSKNGNIYYEARANRSDTPKERAEYSIVKKRANKASPISRKVGKSKQPDRYQPPRYAKMRPPRYRVKPIITPLGETMKDNYFTKIAVGHWYSSSYEYQILEAADGTDKGKWFLWVRHLPNPANLKKCSNEWDLWVEQPMGHTFDEALEYVEKHELSVHLKMWEGEFTNIERRLQMTEGLYNFIARRYAGYYDGRIDDDKVVPIIVKYEKKIHNLPRDRMENIIAFDNFGNILYHGVGLKGECNLPYYIQQVAFYSTHNHPYDHKTPCGFSSGDIDSASEDRPQPIPYNLHMHRACGYGRWWSLLCPHGDAPNDYMTGINKVFIEAGFKGLTEPEKYTAVNEWLEAKLKSVFKNKFSAGELK